MGAGGASWYRVVSSGRRTKRQVLRSRGDRFHDHPEREPTSYVAESIETAWLEVRAHAGEARLNMRTFHAWRVTLPDRVVRGLVDLRARDQQARYRITRAELEADPAPGSGKALARRLRGEGRTGVIYHSVRNRPAGICAAIFLEETEGELRLTSAREEWERFVRRGGTPGAGRTGED